MSPDCPLQPPAGVRVASVIEQRADRPALQRDDWLAEEVPVALVFNGISQAVMMASPHDLEDFALGFGLSEGLLQTPDELHGVEVVPTPDGIEVQMSVSSACAWRLKARRRHMAGRTGCGLCGIDSLSEVCRPSPVLPPQSVPPQALAGALRSLRDWQPMQQLSGATHAAAFCSLTGEILLVREDVGRHNALDKLIGAMVRGRRTPHAGFIAITSRASHEMVHKTAMAGVAVLAAVSAPTARAVDTALQANMALAGFVRGQDFVAYTHPERFGLHTP